MNIIRNPNRARINCLGEQKLLDNIEYKPLVYTTKVDVDNGLLLYNNLTDMLVLLSSEEIEAIEKADINNPVFKELYKNWYFIPDNVNHSNICKKLDKFMTLLTNKIDGTAITTYIIFPTTDCNARCFYCYEKNVKKYHMTEQTAIDVAKFIIKKSCGKKVRLHWFGGEPLYNSKAIDIITSVLGENSIDYISSMISNGYLFDKDLIEKSVNLWNLKRVQITLDGTEEKYNAIKNYIYPNVNAFERVISNIQMLLDSGVYVNIRMNMDNHNYENLYELVSYIFEKFSDYKNISMYSQMLFDESTEKHMNRTADEKINLFKKHQILNEHINEYKIKEKNTLKGYLKNQQCMADKPSATTILPDGHLGKCEHFSDKYFWGSIYSDEIAQENIDLFRKRVATDERCDNCPVLPACLHHIDICPHMKKCNDTLQQSHFENVRNRIINTYEEWKKTNR